MTNTPNYSGLFLRGYGSQAHIKNNGLIVGRTITNHASGALGNIQGDTVRPVNGFMSLNYSLASWWNGDYSTNDLGVFQLSGDIMFGWKITNYGPFINMGVAGNQFDDFMFRNERVTPVANEIRPVNTAVRYLIRSR